MEHNFEKQLHDLEKKGIDRRSFIKILSAAGLLTIAGTQDAKAFSSKATGKIVIIGGGAAGISMAARLKHWLKEPDIQLIDPSDRQYYQPGFTLIASGVYQPDDVWKNQKDCMRKIYLTLFIALAVSLMAPAQIRRYGYPPARQPQRMDGIATILSVTLL